MSNRKQFKHVGGYRPGRSAFDLSVEKLLDCDMGQLIPVYIQECVPGDTFKMSAHMVIRMQPMVAPILHQIDAVTNYFFVPYRLLFDEWESFITGGPDGDYSGPLPLMSDLMSQFPTEKGNLLDFFGWPVTSPDSPLPMTEDNAPLQFPLLAYNFVYNEYFRDQNLIEPVELTQTDVLYRSWEKDYFTASLPFLQRGSPPALPVNTVISGDFITNIQTTVATGIVPSGAPTFNVAGASLPRNLQASTDNRVIVSGGAAIPALGTLSFNNPGLAANSTASSTADSSAELAAVSTSFNISDLRLAAQIQKWQERNARAGVRYTEYLRAHFGVSPRDDRLDRPEYIGGTRTPVIISEVLQTSSSDGTSPQGNLAGHGITIDTTRIGSYRAYEYGIIIGMLSIIPKPTYAAQGVNRQWLRRTRYDFYTPEFAHLSEQGVLNSELYVSGNAYDRGIFGFQGRFDEMRINHNQAVHNMRDTFSYWHLAREFSDLPALNQSFVDCKPSKRIFAVQNEPGFIVWFRNQVLAVRPLPKIGEPGWLDHF
ncbi:major capsid protein [Flyfo microvirus Tbat2_163]|nr:major capsid protein [Flyfo microvirus Tbat2_163]